jgi:hypothetical protein
VVKDNLGFSALLDVRTRDRIDPDPSCQPPGLITRSFGTSSCSVQKYSRRRAERAARFIRDCRRTARRHAGLHGSAQLRDLMELFCVGERFIDALAGGLKTALS